MSREPWQQRVLTEREELARRIARVRALVYEGGFTEVAPLDRELLLRQYVHMGAYLAVLDERIAAWTPLT